MGAQDGNLMVQLAHNLAQIGKRLGGTWEETGNFVSIQFNALSHHITVMNVPICYLENS